MTIDLTLENYASHENKSRGRLYPENSDDIKHRPIYAKDCDLIINSSAFRRLQYKTQVFVNHQGDHYRTRLTHSLEVAQIAKWIAQMLKANQDLAAAISLAHDLGHTPFGHAGEHILNEKMANFDGFSHNANSLKIITKFENRCFEFEGLNLSFETIEGVVKHNGAIAKKAKIYQYIKDYNSKHNLELTKAPTIEAQISAISDDIAYNNHDIEDGLRAGLFEIEQLFEIEVMGKIYQQILKKHPKIRRELLVSEAKKIIVNHMVLDVVTQTKANIKKYNIKTVDDIRNHNKFIVHFSKETEILHQHLKNFLFEKMYRHYSVNRMTANAQKIISNLFDFYISNPNCLPDERGVAYREVKNQKQLAILIADYIAGMTDRFAIKEYEELC
jgi:dGTPase